MNSIKIIRAKDLYNRYKELCNAYQKEGKNITTFKVCEIISKESAPRFYVTEDYAQESMYRIRNGLTQTSRQLKDIYRLWRRCGDIRKTINSPAPSYYLSPERIYRIIIEAVRL